jgi:DNA-binding Lrp family transcriptional regulator
MMDQQDIRTLKIMEALEENPVQTQRDLSRKLKISLGLVNAFTKRLTKKGFYKITTIPKNRIRYAITSKGISEKARLTYKYISYSLQFYKETREKLKNIFEELANRNKARLFFFGASELTEIAMITLKEMDFEFGGIIDDELQGEEFLGHPILDSSTLNQMTEHDAIIVTKINNGTVINCLEDCSVVIYGLIDLSG